jgi:cysteine desulfurase
MKEIFLDNASTTPISKEVEKEIIKTFSEYGNPSSKHLLGEKIKERIERSRKTISNFLNCSPEEIVFTSGGTEGNNMIIKGIAKIDKKKKHILISEIEHPSVVESCNYLKREGYEIEKIKVNPDGIISLSDLEKKIKENTLLVSIMHVNNEIGTIQPIKEITEICKKKKVYFHSDMVQSLKKIKIDLREIDLDFASFSGHKINALKGIGFVYIKKGIKVEPLINGGNQERGIRSGTENTIGIISLAKAIQIKKEFSKIKKIQEYLLKEIMKIPGTIINGSLKKRIPTNLNFSFYGIEGESLMMLLSNKKIFVSTGSACSSNKLTESHVLKAIGVDEMHINGSIRITFEDLNKTEIKYFLRNLRESVEKLQKMSPFKLNSTGG